MAPADRFPWPQRTTVLAGGLLLLSGLLELLVRVRAGLPVTETFVIPLSGSIASFAAAVTRLAAFLVAALGVGGELGFAGRSRTGQVALVLWGARVLTFSLLSLIPIDDAASPAVGITGLVAQVLFVAAAVVSVVLVVRARVLTGFARWVLLPTAVVDVAFLALAYPPPFGTEVALSIMVSLAAWPSELVDPALTLLIAVTLLLWGRTEAVKHRAQVVHDAW